jgi:hypothetical protein
VREKDENDPLTPPINRVELSAWARHNRDDAEQRDARLSKLLQPRIDAHMKHLPARAR